MKMLRRLEAFLLQRKVFLEGTLAGLLQRLNAFKFVQLLGSSMQFEILTFYFQFKVQASLFLRPSSPDAV